MSFNRFYDVFKYYTTSGIYLVILCGIKVSPKSHLFNSQKMHLSTNFITFWRKEKILQWATYIWKLNKGINKNMMWKLTMKKLKKGMIVMRGRRRKVKISESKRKNICWLKDKKRIKREESNHISSLWRIKL